MLLDDNGQAFSSKNLDGAWRIIFFYAKDGSPTCKRGCLTFKEQYDLFESAGCKIVGISKDPKKFSTFIFISVYKGSFSSIGIPAEYSCGHTTG